MKYSEKGRKQNTIAVQSIIIQISKPTCVKDEQQNRFLNILSQVQCQYTIQIKSLLQDGHIHSLPSALTFTVCEKRSKALHRRLRLILMHRL